MTQTRGRTFRCTCSSDKSLSAIPLDRTIALSKVLDLAGVEFPPLGPSSHPGQNSTVPWRSPPCGCDPPSLFVYPMRCEEVPLFTAILGIFQVKYMCLCIGVGVEKPIFRHFTIIRAPRGVSAKREEEKKARYGREWETRGSRTEVAEIFYFCKRSDHSTGEETLRWWARSFTCVEENTSRQRYIPCVGFSFSRTIVANKNMPKNKTRWLRTTFQHRALLVCTGNTAPILNFSRVDRMCRMRATSPLKFPERSILLYIPYVSKITIECKEAWNFRRFARRSREDRTKITDFCTPHELIT